MASLGTPDCKGFLPVLLSDMCAPPFAMVSTSRRSATRSDGFGSLASFGRPCSARACARPGRRCFGVVTVRLPYGNWRVGHRGKRHFPTNVRTVFDLKGWSCEDHRNYASFYAGSSKIAADEITRIEHKGFIETFTERKQVTERWPNAVASKVTLLLKTREDGTTKVRLTIDLRRPGGNGGVELPERVVLPRLSDLTNSVLYLMVYDSETMKVQQGESIGYDLSVDDFEDAFHTLAIREQDRGVMAIRTHEGWAVSRRLCCGLAAALLVWCRVSAAAARLGQACVSTKRATNTNLPQRQSSHVGRRHNALGAQGLYCCFGAFSVLLSTGAKRIVTPLCLGSVKLKEEMRKEIKRSNLEVIRYQSLNGKKAS